MIWRCELYKDDAVISISMPLTWFQITYNFKFLEPNYVSTPATKIYQDVEDNCPMVSLNVSIILQPRYDSNVPNTGYEKLPLEQPILLG